MSQTTKKTKKKMQQELSAENKLEEIEEFEKEKRDLGLQADAAMKIEDDIRRMEKTLKKRLAHLEERNQLLKKYENDPKGWCTEVQQTNLREVRNILFTKVSEAYDSGRPLIDFFPGFVQKEDLADDYGSFSYSVNWGTLLNEIGPMLDILNRNNKKVSYKINAIFPPQKEVLCAFCQTPVTHSCKGEKGVVRIEQCEPLQEGEAQSMQAEDPALVEELERLTKDLKLEKEQQPEEEQKQEDEEEE